MLESNFIEILNTLTPGEFKKLGLFLNSPYFNPNKKLTVYYLILKKYYPDFNKDSFCKENIYKKLYPEKRYNDEVMRNLNSDMQELILRFISQENFEKDIYTRNLKVLDETINRKIHRFFRKNYKKIIAELGTADVNEYNGYYIRYSANSKKIHHDSIVKEFGYNEDDLFDNSKNLICYFLSNIFSLYLGILNMKQLYKSDGNLKFYKETIGLLHAIDFKQIPLINFLYKRLMLFMEPDDETNYKSFRNLMQTPEFTNLSYIEKYGSCMDLRNYCSFKLNHGKSEYKKEIFELYNDMLKLNLYKKDKYMASPLFSNMVNASLRVGQTKWGEDFIENYSRYLAPDEQENTVLTAYSSLNYHKGNYDQALKNLVKTKKSFFPIYNLLIKILSLKIYYEKNDYDSLLSITDTYRKLLNDEKLMSSDRVKYKNFLNFFSQLYKIKENFDEFKLAKIKKKIAETEQVQDKLWLFEKIEELENKITCKSG